MIPVVEIAFWLSIFLILYTYVFFYFVLVLLAAVIPKKRERNNKTLPSVSFIIAAYNENKVIEAKINNCLLLKYPKTKIKFFFGSDHSTDGTDAIIGRFAKRHPQIKLVSFKEREGKAGVINKIAPKAKGDILVFSDANTMYHAESIRRMVSHFADPAVGGVCGKLTLVNPNHNAGGQGETLYWSYENRIKSLEGKIKTVFGATGGIYAIRRRLFRTLPRHHANISDDFLIPMRVVARGYDVVYDTKAEATEYASSSMADEFRRKVRIGTANVFAVREIFPLLGPRNGFIAFGLWSHKIIRWSVPFLMVFLIVGNGFLAGKPFYGAMLVSQIILYLSACLGWLAEKGGIRFKPLLLCYYFVSINLGLLIGYLKYMTRVARPIWDRLER
jgi:cellulose synthase/poly-beta-1,6-N-acetylglucosamine synthase-like glycosyltransferase